MFEVEHVGLRCFMIFRCESVGHDNILNLLLSFKSVMKFQ